MKEKIAATLNAREHQVAQALHKLNLEGLVCQKDNFPPHDCNRNHGSDSSWCGSRYYVWTEEEARLQLIAKAEK